MKLRLKDRMILRSRLTLVLKEKCYFLAGVIVLRDNIYRDKHLNTADSRESSEAVNLSQMFFKITIRQSI
jgi:hypothetical protein